MPIAVLIAIAFLLITGYGILTGATQSILGSVSSGDNLSLSVSQVPSVPTSIHPSDTSSWPNGDRIWDCCRAIAIAEGYNVPGSNPANLNNPGDISDGASVYGSEFHSGSSITKFPDAQTGWKWLYAKLTNILNGTSTVYDASYSWREIGAKWAPPNAEVWASNVSSVLGVDADSSISDYINA
jgi:hypothetical protein